MASRLLLAAAVAGAQASAEGTTPIVTFDGEEATTHEFKELNDPVMGGKSTGTWRVNATGGFGIFDGEVVDVPALRAPGFIEAHADGKFPDVSAAGGGDLLLTVRSSPVYSGWKVSLASGALSPTLSCATGGSSFLTRGCFKAPFQVPAGDDFVTVRVPFSSFTDKWNNKNGEPTVTCQQDASTCLTAKKLQAIQRVELMAEGVAGTVHLEVKSISAAAAQGVNDADVVVEQFGGGKSMRAWHAENDPVMGGRSESKASVEAEYLEYKGSCRIVPALKAPGFTIAMTGTPLLAKKFPDVSSKAGLLLNVRNAGAAYAGFKVAFCDSRNPYTCQFKSFKADFSAPPSADFQDVFVPWSNFSNSWDAATGKHTAENPPTASSLKSITQMQLWTEGAEGDFDLMVKYIKATAAPGGGSTLVV